MWAQAANYKTFIRPILLFQVEMDSNIPYGT